MVPAGTPEDADRAVPQVADLLSRPVRAGERTVTPGAGLALTEEAVYPRVARQSGRFVVPVEINILLSSEEVRKEKRKDLDRSLRQLPLPAACVLELPPLKPRFWERRAPAADRARPRRPPAPLRPRRLPARFAGARAGRALGAG